VTNNTLTTRSERQELALEAAVAVTADEQGMELPEAMRRKLAAFHRAELDRLDPPPRNLTAKQAAERLNFLNSKGQPTDTFYNSVLPMIGYQPPGSKEWRVPLAQIERLERRLR
jgi:hypothetical protein